MKKSLFILLFLGLIVSSVFGGQWSIANAQGTIPVVPPGPTGGEPIVPVTGGTTKTIVIPEQCANVSLSIEFVAEAVFKDCPKPGTEASMLVLKPEDIPQAKEKVLTFLTEVFQITVDGTHKVELSVFLSEEEISKLKQDPSYGLYRFDPITQEWVRVVATLDGNFLKAETDVSGIFAVGKF